jgi:hypothetical protein
MKGSSLWSVRCVTIAACVLAGAAINGWADTLSWVDELSNSVSFYAADYPGSNWQPYQDRLTVVRDAVGRGDQRIVKTEMTTWFKMLRQREYGINDVAADELFNFALMVTPIQEFNIAVPTIGTGGF